MSRKNKNKKVWQQYVANVFMILIGALFGFFMVMYVDGPDFDGPLYIKILSLVGLLAVMYISVFLHVIVHEAGHLIFGLLSGYNFSSFRIFSFMWLKENGKIRLKKLTIAGTGGQCLMTPPDVKKGKVPVVLYNLGGSIMNTAVSALFLILYFVFRHVPYLSAVLFIFSLVGFLLALMNGIPMRMGTVDNDGYNAIVMSRNTEATEAFVFQTKVLEQIVKGIRLKDMPSDWFEIPSDDAMKNSMVAARGVFACNRMMDEKDFKAADALMEHILDIDSGIVGLHRDLLTCDRMYVELIGENRRSVMEEMLSPELRKFMKSMKTFPSVLRTEYALALLFENDKEKSETIKAQFEKCAKTYPYPHEIASERELMDIALEKFKGEE